MRRMPGFAPAGAALLLGLAAAVVAPPGLATQQADSTLRRPSQQELDSLFSLYVDARVRWVHESEAEGRARGDSASAETTMVGPWTVVAIPSRMAEARTAMDSAWSVFAPYVDDPRRVLGHFITGVLILWEGDPPILPRELPELGLYEMEVRRRFAWHEDVRQTVARFLETHLAEGLVLSEKGSLAWGEAGLRPAEPGHAYRLLASRDEAIVRDCRRGDAASCWGALGLAEAEPKWKGWLRADDYAEAVSRIPPGSFTRSGPLREECLRTRAPDVCEQALLALPLWVVQDRWPAPLGSQELVWDLAWFAVRAGGAGALDRLIAGPQRTLRGRMAAAARQDPDSLVLAWIAGIEAQGIDREGQGRRRRSAALLWYLLLLVPAARSTRWRLG